MHACMHLCVCVHVMTLCVCACDDTVCMCTCECACLLLRDHKFLLSLEFLPCCIHPETVHMGCSLSEGDFLQQF